MISVLGFAPMFSLHMFLLYQYFNISELVCLPVLLRNNLLLSNKGVVASLLLKFFIKLDI